MADFNNYLSRKFVLLRFIFLLLTLFMKTALSDFLPSILWATYNPFFSRLGESPRTVFLKDTIHLVCPNKVDYPAQSVDEYQNNKLHANIYRVDKQGYDNCDANGGIEIRICNDPNSVLSKKIVILDIAINPQNPAFKPGQIYYFIDTSDGSKENVSSKVGGKCQTHNMKMKMYVCANQSDSACPNGNGVTNGGWSPWGSCSNAGIQTRQCNNPVPSNGGYGCQGNSTRPCLVATPSTATATMSSSTSSTKQPDSNDTVTPQKGRRTSNSNDLGTLSIGAVVGIFLAVLIGGIILGIVLGLFIAKRTSIHRPFILRKRKKEAFVIDNSQFDINDLTPGKNAVDQFNRSSVASTAKMRPFSTVSNDTTLTNVTGYTSYNDIYDQANKNERLC